MDKVAINEHAAAPDIKKPGDALSFVTWINQVDIAAVEPPKIAVAKR